jgi:hypothetical protein
VFPTSSNWESFCSLPCTHIISACHHGCNLPCHSPSLLPHSIQKDCSISLQRPCVIHSNIPLLCKEITYKLNDTPISALRGFKCEVEELYQRPECDHTVKLPCHILESIKGGRSNLDACTMKVKDFVQPSCSHRIKSPSCDERRKYEVNRKLNLDCIRNLYPNPNLHPTVTQPQSQPYLSAHPTDSYSFPLIIAILSLLPSNLPLTLILISQGNSTQK